MIDQFLAALIAFAITIVAMPWAIKVAHERGILDVPADDRRQHREPVPRIGGVAIFGATAVAATVFLVWGLNNPAHAVLTDPRLPGVVLGGVIVFICGVVDDA